MSRYELFDRSRICCRHIAERGHDLLETNVLPLSVRSRRDFPELPSVAKAIRRARERNRPVIALIGGHPIKLGLSRFLIDLIERGFVTHLATNGAGIIHDFELAFVGGTRENVAKWIREGQFGLWQETSQLNAIICEAAERGEGLGEAVGRVIGERCFTYRHLSIAAAGYRTGVPVTSHVSIGSDIIHAMANCSGAALGQTSYTDFLIFARSVQKLEGGVFFNVGSAVTGPEVFLKALSMARNVERREGRELREFTTAVFDLVDLPSDWREGVPGKDHPQYYFRPWKTLLCRTVRDGGTSHYVRGDHCETLPSLWAELVGAIGCPTGNHREQPVESDSPMSCS